MRNLNKMLIAYFLLLSPITAYAQESRLFWIDQSYKKIQSSRLNGSHVTDVVTDIQFGEGVAIDSLSTPMKIYYSEGNLSRIIRMSRGTAISAGCWIKKVKISMR